MRLTSMCLVLSLTAGLVSPFAISSSIAAEPIPVILDTDIGTDVDDAFALALAIASPELKLVGVTTVGAGNEWDRYVGQRKDRDDHRAWLVCRFLSQAGAVAIPVAAGADPQPKIPLDWQIQYRRHPAAIYNRTLKPVQESAVELMARLLKEQELTIIATGPLTNIARLVREHPDAIPRIKRILITGGAVNVGYDGKSPPQAEWNIKADVEAARTVFASGVPLLVLPLDATATVWLDAPMRKRLFAAHTPLTWQVQNLYELWDKQTPLLYAPVAVGAVFTEEFLKIKDLRLAIDDSGKTLVREGKPNSRVAVGVNGDEFVGWYVERLRGRGKETLPRPPGNASRLIEPGNFPTRVHAFEDYDTDIEKRWWMCGKVEADGWPLGRVCRAVLTQDFDDLQGDTGTMYRAVIFNPVPGPPMGPRTRLKFQYKLSGTDTLRIQLYSLTNGYHRYLSVSGLKQGEWEGACVDMTQMRRPDGSGGPLALDERIDDIQFYVDPRAELLIDDILLYEAAAETQTRPFPLGIMFTAWFDTGKQGQEWPGDFEIVSHEPPRTWKAAKSVPGPEGTAWIRISMRGERQIHYSNELNFQYQCEKADKVTVELFNSRNGKAITSASLRTHPGSWRWTTLKFNVDGIAAADEIRFLGEKGSELHVDDVLLIVPGNERN